VAGFVGSVAKSNPMDMLRTAVSMLSIYDPQAKDMSPEANHEKATKLMAQTATIVTTFDRLRNGKPVVDGDPSLGFRGLFRCRAGGPQVRVGRFRGSFEFGTRQSSRLGVSPLAEPPGSQLAMEPRIVGMKVQQNSR